MMKKKTKTKHVEVDKHFIKEEQTNFYDLYAN